MKVKADEGSLEQTPSDESTTDNLTQLERSRSKLSGHLFNRHHSDIMGHHEPNGRHSAHST